LLISLLSLLLLFPLLLDLPLPALPALRVVLRLPGIALVALIALPLIQVHTLLARRPIFTRPLHDARVRTPLLARGRIDGRAFGAHRTIRSGKKTMCAL
jgi:hypothetical protein